MIYLASPYTHPDKEVMESRFRCAETALFLALRDEYWVYSPIVHCHEIAKKNRLRTDHEFWLRYDTDFLRRCDELWTLCINGWIESIGVTYERKLAMQLGIPRKLMEIHFHEYDSYFSLKDDNLEP